MQVRSATVDDVPAMLRLQQESPTAAHWTPQAYDALFAAGATPFRVLIAVDDSANRKIVGFIVARGLETEWEIENLVVVEDLRRQGIGGRLVHSLLRDLSAAGASAILLEVRESNVQALRLYEKAGFTVEGRRRGYYRNPAEDALLLRRSLRLCNNMP